jgi:hypothetical protein
MTVPIDHDLHPNQWEALKALRTSLRDDLAPAHRPALAGLVDLGLATLAQGRPAITPAGRLVLLRGSPRLWDVAA